MKTMTLFFERLKYTLNRVFKKMISNKSMQLYLDIGTNIIRLRFILERYINTEERYNYELAPTSYEIASTFIFNTNYHINLDKIN